MAEVFELHNRDKLEIYAFSSGKNITDPMRFRMMGSFDHFIDVSDKNPCEISTLSREPNIDIAVVLCGFRENARTEICLKGSADPGRIYRFFGNYGS